VRGEEKKTSSWKGGKVFCERGASRDIEWYLERSAIAPYGYLLGHYAKFIVPGSVRLNVESSDPRVRLTAFQRPDGILALVGLNNNPVEIQARVSLSGLAKLPTNMSVLSSREGALWREDADTSVQQGEISVTLAPLSVTTLVSR
jgi:O-glycosyl hydrolase